MDFEKYQNGYNHIRFKREDGILELRIHTNDGPAVWDALGPGDLHAELGDAFYQVGRDPENSIIIFTGTGDEFITEWNRYTGKRDAAMSVRITKEAKDLIQNLLDIDVPVIGAANGPALVHPELMALSDIVIASERASFADRQHFLLGYVPGDGSQVWWDMLLGPNRCRHFLLTGREMGAEEAKQLGVVAEVVPHEQVLDRAWEVARELLAQPRFRLRNTRIAMTQHIKRRMLDELGYGLALSATSNFLRTME